MKIADRITKLEETLAHTHDNLDRRCAKISDRTTETEKALSEKVIPVLGKLNNDILQELGRLRQAHDGLDLRITNLAKYQFSNEGLSDRISLLAKEFTGLSKRLDAIVNASPSNSREVAFVRGENTKLAKRIRRIEKWLEAFAMEVRGITTEPPKAPAVEESGKPVFIPLCV